MKKYLLIDEKNKKIIHESTNLNKIWDERQKTIDGYAKLESSIDLEIYMKISER